MLLLNLLRGPGTHHWPKNGKLHCDVDDQASAPSTLDTFFAVLRKDGKKEKHIKLAPETSKQPYRRNEQNHTVVQEAVFYFFYGGPFWSWMILVYLGGPSKQFLISRDAGGYRPAQLHHSCLSLGDRPPLLVRWSPSKISWISWPKRLLQW